MNFLSYKAQLKIWLFLQDRSLEVEFLGQGDGLITAKLLSKKVHEFASTEFKQKNKQKTLPVYAFH